MHFFELKISTFGCGHRHGEIVDFLVELVEYLIGNDGLKAIDDAILILLRIVFVLIMPVQEPQPFFYIVAVRHVDQSQELILVVNCIIDGLHM